MTFADLNFDLPHINFGNGDLAIGIHARQS